MWKPTVYSDELYHHGIIGMKWGVRRYQNQDGTLTAAGRSRYIKEMKRDMKSHYESQVGKRVSKHLRINNNFTESAGSSAGKAYRKGKLTDKDYKAASKARAATKKYMTDKYGEDAVKAMMKSGVIGRKIDNFTPKTLTSGKNIVEKTKNKKVTEISTSQYLSTKSETEMKYDPKKNKMVKMH